MDRAVGFILMCFHVISGGISVLLLFMAFLTRTCKVLVGFFVEVWKLFVCMKSYIFDSYCAVGKITREFPLSAHLIRVPWSLSSVFMDLIALDSECV